LTYIQSDAAHALHREREIVFIGFDVDNLFGQQCRYVAHVADEREEIPLTLAVINIL